MVVYRNALKAGVTGPNYEEYIGGYLIRVGLKNGRLDTAFGFVKMTLDDFSILL